MKIGSRQASLVALAVLLGLGIAAIGAGVSYRELNEARNVGAAPWRDIVQIHAQRARIAAVALDAAARAEGLDPAMIDHARSMLARATALSTPPQLLNDPQAIDTYKHYQGELTGELFQLVGRAQAIPALADNDALQALRAELPRDEIALAAARSRYEHAAANYNTLAKAFPAVAVAALIGYEKLPTQL